MGSRDFRGLRRNSTIIQWLGVDCLWLLPFFPSPLRDDGYDVANYRAISPEYGSLEEFRHFLDAHQRGIRVIVDLVNHTSDQHPWFQQARSSPESATRDYYVWSQTDKRYEKAWIIFIDTEKSNWTWDPYCALLAPVFQSPTGFEL